MKKNSRKSINPRQSFVLPRHSDVVEDKTVYPDEVEFLRDISVAARPSLMSSPDGGLPILGDSNLPSAELRKRFPDDHEWYKRLSNFSQPLLTPRAQRKTLRLPDADGAAEEPSDESGREASIAGRKPFRKKKLLFSRSKVYDKVLDDTTLPEDDESVPQPGRRIWPNVSLATRRSDRLRLQSSAVDSSSPMESPREKIRRWTSTTSRRKSRGLAEAIQGLRKSHEGVTIHESHESASVSIQLESSASKDKQRVPQSISRRKVSIFEDPADKDNKSSSISEDTSVTSPPVRPKLFGKARKSRFSIGAVLDETSDSVEPTEQSPRRTSNRLNATSEEVSIADAKDVLRPRLFAEKTKDKKRRFSAFERVLDADDSERSVDEIRENNRSISKSSRKENPTSSKESRNSVAEESPTLPVERKLFAKRTQKTRGSFAEVLDGEESSTFSTAETEIFNGMPGASVDGKNAANESQSGQQEPGSSVTLKDSAHYGETRVDVEIEPIASASPKERRQLFAGSSRKSRRSSAFVAAMEDDEPVTEAPSEENLSSKKRRVEQQVQSPEQDTSHPGRLLGRRWAVAKGRERVNKYQEIMSMDSSDTSSSDVEAENKENEPDFNETDKAVFEKKQKRDDASGKDEDLQSNAEIVLSFSKLTSPSKRKSTDDIIRSELNKESSKQIYENSFVVPAVHPKRPSLRQRLFGMEMPSVVIPHSLIEAVTSTPTPNATKMVLPSPMSTIKNLSEKSYQNPLEQSAKVASTQSISENEDSQPAGEVDKSPAKPNSASESRRSKHTFSSQEKLARKEQRSDMFEKDGDLHSNGERVTPSPSSKSPPKRKSTASDRQKSPNKRQSARRMEQSETAQESSEEDANADLPSSAERVLSSSRSKSSPKRKSTASERQKSPNKRQSARRLEQSETAQESSEEDANADLPSSAERVLSSSRSKSSPKRKSTASERQKSPNKRQSARRMDQSKTSQESFEEENDDDNLPSSADKVLPSPSSKKRTSRYKTIRENERHSSRNDDSSSESSKAVEQRKSSLKQSSGIYESGRNSRRPTSAVDSVMEEKSTLDTVGDNSGESVEESNAAKRKLTSDQNPQRTSTANSTVSIFIHPSGNLIEMSSKSSSRKLSEGTKVALPNDDSRLDKSVTGKTRKVANVLPDKATSVETHVSGRSTSHAEAALPPPPIKSTIPRRVRSDIRNFFVKSTPLKEQLGDHTDSFVPFDATVITPIKKLGNLSARSDEESLFLQGKASTAGKSTPDEDRRCQDGDRPGPSSERIQELMKKLMERLPERKEDARPQNQERVFIKGAKRTQTPKAASRKFQLILPDGKVYKQPKLPKPRKFVSDKMYRFIAKNIKNNSALDTRVRAEEFVKRLCDTYDRVLRRKNSKKLVEELLEDMVRLGLVTTYKEFYTFVEKFMPFSFRIKAIPCVGSDLAPMPKKGINEKLDFD